MNLEIGCEPLSALLDDGLAELVRKHWEEVGVYKDEMPLEVDWGQYRRLEDQGTLKIFAARLNDELIGYNSFIVTHHLHYRSTLHALGDAIYVLPEKRRSGAGPLMIEFAEKQFARMASPGKCRIVYHDKAFLDYLGPLLKKRGYQHVENIYNIMVGA